MYALSFDDLKRKLARAEKPVELRALSTCTLGTAEWETYWRLANLPGNVIDVMVEPDHRTYTFYTIHPKDK